MSTDNLAPSELAPAGTAETLYVNIREPLGPIGGVLLYYAVLAYPEHGDWQKRESLYRGNDGHEVQRIRSYKVLAS